MKRIFLLLLFVCAVVVARGQSTGTFTLKLNGPAFTLTGTNKSTFTSCTSSGGSDNFDYQYAITPGTAAVGTRSTTLVFALYNPPVTALGSTAISYQRDQNHHNWSGAAGDCLGNNHTFTNLGSITVDVVADLVWSATFPSNVCVNGSSIDLYGYVNKASGVVFRVDGNVVASPVSPSTFSAGAHTLSASYTFDNGVTTVNTGFTATATPTFTFSPPTNVCGDATGAINLSNYVSNASPGGGTFSFSGPGVSGSGFDPVAAGNGSKSVSATYTTSCVSSPVNASINVVTTYTPSAGPNMQVCNGSITTLAGSESPAGGTWSGTGVSGSNFDASVGVGIYTVTYTTNVSGCVKAATKTVQVLALPAVEAGSNISGCNNSSSIDLTTGGVSPSTGVWSSPNSTVNSKINNGNNTLNGNGIAAGTYTLTYTVTSGGCPNSDTRSITINAPPTVDAGADFNACINGGNVALTGGSPAGGTWSGTGVTGSTFNPTTAGVGNHTITYTASASGCTTFDTRIISVISAGAIDAGINLDVCVNTGTINLTGASPAGGTWSGTGVTGSTFDSSIGVGSYTVTYTATSGGCVGTDTRTVTVNAKPTVEAGNNLTTCVNSSNFNLNGFSPSGGTWSGNGLIGPTLFSPSTAGVGTHNLTYTYTNGNGCTSNDFITVVVNNTTTVNIGSDKTFCSNSSSYNLNSDIAPANLGGTWSGSGVSGNNFMPFNVSPGAYTITYTYTNANGCVSTQNKQFTIVAGPSVDAGNTMEICVNGGTVNLVGESPSGGTWSGFGVSGSQFDPAVSGTGVFTVTYAITTSQCTITDTRQVTVNAATTVDAGPNLTVCGNASDFLLTGASINGGIWNGSGVAGGYFSPSSVVAGTYVVSYTYTNNKGCQSTDTRQVTVNAAPVVDAGIDKTICSNAGLYNLIADVNVTGGTFSGPGVQGLNFNPSIAGVGVHQINYTYTAAATGCSKTDYRYISVISPQSVSIGSNLTVCVSAAPFALVGESMAGGTYSGNGVTSGNFSAAVAGVGTHTITYTVVDANGCNAVGTKTISVIALPTVEAGQDIFVCSGAPLVSLNGTGQPVGGTFSGAFVSGGNFDVSASGAGTFLVTYTYTNANGCTNTDTKNIIVDAGATVNAGADFSVCVGGPLVDLASRVSPGGGTFVGTGVNGTNFNPSAGPGSYTITYSLTNSYGCAGSDTFVVTVNPLPTVNAGSTKTLCLNEPSYDLSLTAVPSGGSFFGPGVNANLFNPSSAGVGTHTIYYTYTNPSGCSNTATRTLTVTDLPAVNVGANLFMCANGNLVDLSVGVTPTGGVWSGTGITNGIFNPSNSGVGIHTATYTITQSNGCSNSGHKVITVFAQLSIDAGPDFTVCSNAGIVNLNNGASVTGGTWAGSGVTGSNFNPATTGPGVFQINYNYTNFYGCTAMDSKTITVISPASVSVGSDLSMCVTGSTIDLSSSVFPTGGVFTGTGVSGNIFNPALAGIGAHTISYTVVDGVGCNTTKNRILTVTAPPTIDAGPNKVLCLASGLVDLDVGASVTGGTWSGTAVNGSFFNPASAGIGTYVITYTYNNGLGCVSTDTKSITVRADAVVDAGPDLTFCVNAAPFDLISQPDKPGGTWSGVGVTGTIFTPGTAGPGLQTVSYRYTDAFGCVANDFKVINVNDKPVVSAGSAISLCTTASAVNLSNGAFPAGGTWTGAGLSGTFFNPALVGTGVYSLTYSYTDGNSCKNNSTKQVTVSFPPVIDVGANKTICLSSGLLDLSLASGVTGGTWSGPGVSNNYFDPAFTGAGTFPLSFTYNNGQGCISTASKTIIVRNDPSLNAGPDLGLCVNATPISLSTQVNLQGGTWSGNGLSNGSFNPTSAGLGVHNLKYSYTDSYGCTVSDFVIATVNSVPIVNAGPDATVCSTNGPVNLTQSVFPVGGSWFGPGTTGNTFDPSLVSVGPYDLVYSFTNSSGCNATDSKKITVTLPEVITVAQNLIVCANSSRVDLSQGTSKLGGVWSGTGLEGNFFNPTLAGVGSFVLTYTYNNGQGCISVANRTIEVKPNISVDAGSDLSLCINSGLYNLIPDASISGGTWTGVGITNGQFNPASSGVGSFVLTYKVSNAYGCEAIDTRIVIVNSVTLVDAGPPASTCVTAAAMNLLNGVSIQGGSFSGPGIVGNSFDPGLTGVGVFDVTYTYINPSGCVSTDTRKITVVLPEVVTIGANLIVCVDGSTIDLDLAVSKIGGIWSGPGISGSYFDPAAAGIGTHNITYTYDNGQGCISMSSKTIQVRPAITVNAGPDISMCVNESLLNLTLAVDKSGGVFSGNGVSGNNYNPAAAGVGSHVITYTYHDNIGCAAVDTRTIVVNGTTTVEAGPDATVCTTAPLFDLSSGVSVTGGVWSGSGITGNNFNPAAVGVGSFNLLYTYTNGSGCVSTDTRKVTVVLPEVVTIGANQILCANGSSIDLDLAVSKIGGTWSGPGITGSYFDPAVAGIGTHTVTYSINNGQGCISSASKTIQVRAAATVNAGPDISVCVNAALVNLALAVDKSGGVFSGNGVSGNNFNPATAGVGSHVITYTYHDDIGCAAVDTRTIVVNGTTTVEAGPDATVCTTAPLFDLSSGVSVAGGVWSGSGITGNNFNPAAVGVGSFNLLYTYTNGSGCVSTDTRKVTVVLPEVVTIGANQILCANGSSIDLDLAVSKIGGTWSGPGITGSYFDPAVAGIGTHTVTYSINNGQGCISSASKTIQVRAAATVNAGPDISVCVNAALVNLALAVDKSGGVFSGNGVSGNNFNPATAGVGSHVITYTYNDAIGCAAVDTRTIVVNGITIVDAGPDATVCTTAPLFDLSSGVSVAGGVWSGSGVTGSSFNPAAVGVGSFNLLYTYTNGTSCVSTDSRKVTVVLPEVVTIGANQILCANGSSIDLDLAVSKIGGTWSGPGITGSYFDPAVAGIGTHTVTYSINNGQGCISSASKTIQVRAAATVNAGPDISVCVNAALVNLALAVDKSGGVFSGNGVSGNNFNPATAGAGSHVITYTYHDDIGCAAVDTRTIVVNGITIVDAGPDATVCTTAPLFDLSSGVSVAGGVWSGSGVTGSSFNPAAVGAGSFNLLYTYTNGSGCVSSDTRKITVVLPETISIGANQILCLNSQSIDLDLGVSKIGGTWSGPGISGSFFNSATAGVGTHTVTYVYNNGQGCISSASKIIQVRATPLVNAGPDVSLCSNGTLLNLTLAVDKSGGVFSGNGVSGNNFNPVTAGVGSHVITYTYHDDIGCAAVDTRTIVVNSVTAVDAGPAASICTTAPALNLMSSVSVAGGTWSGPGVSGNTFTASSVGTGDFDLVYSFVNANGCTSSDVRKVTVTLPPVVNIGANMILCANSPRIDLDLNVSKIGGSWSGSAALEGSFFNPATAGTGNHLVTYTYTEISGCVSTASKTIQVRPALTVNAGIDKTFCSNAGIYNLSNDADLAGGSWSGTGVTGTTFNPKTAGIGAHTITYIYHDDFGCSASDTRLFTVSDEINVNAGPDFGVCLDAASINLGSAGFPSGGTWSGEGIVNNILTPSSLGAGSYTMSYTYTAPNGCFAVDTRVVTVNNLPTVEAGANFEICVNAAPLSLTGASPSNGTWSGTGVIAGIFDPLSAGLGNHVLQYAFTDQRGCSSSDQITVKVLAEPTLQVGSDLTMCLNETSRSLLPDVSIKGGTFQGNGMTGTIFNPEDAGAGSHVITYTVRFNGCDLLGFRTITVYDPQSLDIGANLTVCVASDPFDLVKDVNVVGGAFSGNGVDVTTFRPSVAGVGSHVITYTYTNAFGCTSTDFRIVTVQTELPINAGDDITLCSSVTAFDLTGRGAPAGGIYVGTGVLNNHFNPATSGLGTFRIEYVVDNGNGCVSRDEMVVTVKQSTITDFGEDKIMCITAQPLPLNFNSQLSGGTWSGPGVVNNVFYPSLADIGTHALRYTNQTLDCDIAGNRNITIVGLPGDASSTLKNVTACEGAFINLTAEVEDADRIRNVNVGWFRDGDDQPFDLGEEIIYQVGTTERVYYKSIDQYGCTSGQRDYVNVQTNNPTATIESNEETINFGKPVQFFARTVKNAEKFEWDFGDGLISYDRDPWHYYYKSGIFDISLKLTSSSGCVTTISAEDILEVLPEPGRDESKAPSGGRVGSSVTLKNVYPNPFSENFHFTLESPVTVEYEITVINAMGIGRSLGIILVREGENEFTVDGSEFTAGIYYFKLVGPAGILTFNAIKK